MQKLRFEEVLFNTCQTIKGIRKDKGLTQGLIAERIQAPQSMIARFESGKINDAHISVLFRICEAIEEDMVSVLAKAVSRTIANQEPVGNDLITRWEILKEKFHLLENKQQEDLIEIFERIFKVAQ